MMGQLGQVMVGVADNIMIGHVGTVPLAAASLANSLFIIVLVFGIGSSFAISPMTAQAQGANDLPKIAQILKNALVVNTSLGLLLGSLAIIVSFMIPYMNQPPEVVSLAMPYLRVIGLSIIPLMIFQAFRQFSEGLSLTVPPMLIIVGTNLLNILFNYILIFGKFGFPEMGLLGAGIATLLARIFMLAAMAFFTFRSQLYKAFLMHFHSTVIGIRSMKQIMALGFPMGLQFTFEVTAFAFSAVMIGWMGATELAAHQIAINMASVAFMMASGIASAASIRVGNQYGKRDIKTMREAAFTCAVMVVIFMALSATLFISLRNVLPMLYIKDPAVIAVASSLLIIAGIFQFSDGLQVVGLGMLRGISDVKIPTFITLFAYWGVGLPAGYLLGFYFDLGPEGIWYGLLIGLSIAAALLLVRFNRVSGRMVESAFPQVPNALEG